VDGVRGTVIVPVVSLGNDVVGTNITAVEAPVVGVERTVVVEEFVVVRDNIPVITNMSLGATAKIVVEGPDARPPLLEDNGLGLDLTDLLRDDLLGKLLEDNKPLLNDFDLLGMANDVLLVDNMLLVVGRVKVLTAVEVVEALQGFVPSPAFEGERVATGAQVDWGGNDGRNHGGKREESDGEFGKHGCNF